MNIKDEFNRQFQPEISDISLPERLAGAYRPESCLLCREGNEVWRLSGPGDGRFVLKIDRTGKRNLAGEFALMGRLPQDLEGRVPLPVDYFEEDGVRYLLRTYIPGRPLSEIWEPGDARRCVEIGTKLCALLDRLHGLDESVIHRDIKPENIILSPEGEPGLIDFGIARIYKEGRESDTMFMGTRSTAPPEQYGYAQTDRRADIYSLGATLCWMLTGSYKPEALEGAECPPTLKRCLNKAAAFAPKDRYPSAGEFGRALAASLEKPRKQRGLLAGAACLAAALVLFLCWPRNGRVEFDNALLEQAVRAELGKPQGDITVKDLERVERLALVGRKLLEEEQSYRYTCYSYIDNVPQMDEPYGDISDLSLLARMSNLETLCLCQQQISDLSPLAGLPLKELNLSDNQISDLSPLASVASLQVLYLGGNPFEDLTPLSGLELLRVLNLDTIDRAHLDSFAPLGGLGMLEQLSLGNRIPADGDWSPLEKLNEVWEIWLWDPPDRAFVALAEMTGLRDLQMGNYWAESLRAADLPRIHLLSLYNAPCSLEGIEQMKSLEWLNLCGLESISLEPVAQSDSVHTINITNCQIEDYAPLLRVPALKEVGAWDEQAVQDVERDCPEGIRTFQVAGP